MSNRGAKKLKAAEDAQSLLTQEHERIRTIIKEVKQVQANHKEDTHETKHALQNLLQQQDIMREAITKIEQQKVAIRAERDLLQSEFASTLYASQANMLEVRVATKRAEMHALRQEVSQSNVRNAKIHSLLADEACVLARARDDANITILKLTTAQNERSEIEKRHQVVQGEVTEMSEMLNALKQAIAKRERLLPILAKKDHELATLRTELGMQLIGKDSELANLHVTEAELEQLENTIARHRESTAQLTQVLKHNAKLSANVDQLKLELEIGGGQIENVPATYPKETANDETQAMRRACEKDRTKAQELEKELETVKERAQHELAKLRAEIYDVEEDLEKEFAAVKESAQQCHELAKLQAEICDVEEEWRPIVDAKSLGQWQRLRPRLQRAKRQVPSHPGVPQETPQLQRLVGFPFRRHRHSSAARSSTNTETIQAVVTSVVTSEVTIHKPSRQCQGKLLQ